MWKVTEMVEDRKKGENDTERQCAHHIWKFVELTEHIDVMALASI